MKATVKSQHWTLLIPLLPPAISPSPLNCQVSLISEVLPTTSSLGSNTSCELFLYLFSQSGPAGTCPARKVTFLVTTANVTLPGDRIEQRITGKLFRWQQQKTDCVYGAPQRKGKLWGSHLANAECAAQHPTHLASRGSTLQGIKSFHWVS